jgi:surfeit locus 1 family protein
MPTTAAFRFRPPWWAVALAAAGCAAGILLGQWQSGRAEQKRALAAALKPVALRGEFLPKAMILLDNKLYRGRPGYQVLQALRVPGGTNVLVNRGWIAAGPSRAKLPEVRTPAGEVVLEGLRLEHLPRAYEFGGTEPQGTVWQNASPARFAAWSGLAMEPWVFEQHSALDDGLAREWPKPDFGVEMHESYALQWYSLAGLSVILLFALNLKHDKPGA